MNSITGCELQQNKLKEKRRILSRQAHYVNPFLGEVKEVRLLEGTSCKSAPFITYHLFFSGFLVLEGDI